MQPKPILLIETSTAVCSAALCVSADRDGASPRILASRCTSAPKAHASQLAVFIDQLFQECHITARDCAAVAVSMGPGSYTGLRVGVSTAKGICFGAHLPLLAVSSLQLIAQHYLDSCPSAPFRIVPMIDARRMEVYTATFSVKDSPLGPLAVAETPVTAQIIDAHAFQDLLEQGPMVFVGDGAPKCRPLLTHSNAQFVDVEANACGMAKDALLALQEGRTEDVAYFTPFYLKEFQAATAATRM